MGKSAIVLASVLLAVGLAACAGSGEGEDPTSAPTTSSTPTSATSGPATEAPDDPQPSPPPLTLMPVGDDFEPVIREIFAFRSWLFAHPNRTDLIGQIYHPDCPCAQELKDELDAQLARGELIHGNVSLVEMSIADDRPESKFFTIERATTDLVLTDLDGRELATQDSAPNERSLWQLTRTDSGSWLVLSIRAVES